MATVASSTSKRPAESPLNPAPVKKTALASRWSILFVAKGDPIEDVMAIGMDQYRICIGNIGERCLLAARGIGAGFAICQRGKTKDGNPIIGLCHTPNLQPIKSVIHFLSMQMIHQGAVKKTIQTAIIGGMMPDSKDEEEEIRELAKKQPLITCLNVVEHPEIEEEPQLGLAVVVDPNQILISEEEEFLLYTPTWNEESVINNEENGIELPEGLADDSTESDDSTEETHG